MLPAMATTTIRVDTETHALLSELSRASGMSLIDTVREAAEALRRRRFAERVTDELVALRSDPKGWQDYLDEAGSTEVSDGIG
jgi:hypothetical protein